MTISFSEFAATHCRNSEGFYPRIQLVDGSSFSCQASDHHDSQPRLTFDFPLGVYDAYELFFEDWMLDPKHSYLKEWITKDTILSYVPKTIVSRVVQDRGGIIPSCKKRRKEKDEENGCDVYWGW